MTKIDTNHNAAAASVTAKGPATTVKAPPTATQLQAMQNAAFDKSFSVSQAFMPADDQPLAPMTPQEQLSLWTGLAHTPLMGAPSKEKAADAFVFNETPVPSPSDEEVTQLTRATGNSPAVEHALGKLGEAMTSRQLNALTERLALMDATAGGLKPIKPQVLAQIQAQVIAPLSKQIRASLGQAGSSQTGAGLGNAKSKQQGGNSESTSSDTAGGKVIQPDFGALKTYVSSVQAAGGMNIQGMDIESLVEMTIMQCGQDSELDLREIATQMQTNLNMSKALRGLKDQQTADAARIKKQVDAEYLQLTSVQPPATKPVIDPNKCTQSQFETWRGVNIVAPTIDDSVSPPKVNYQSPTLADPTPLNEIDIPSAFKPGPTPDQNSAVTAAQKDLDTATTEQTQAQAALDAANATLGKDAKNAPSYAADAQAVQTAQDALTAANTKVDKAKTDLKTAKDAVAAAQPSPSSNGGTGAKFPNTTADLSPDGAWLNDTATRLQDQSDISQQMQLKMQMAQQAYTQCMQMVSNIMKTDNDTKSAIIKNLSN